MLDRDEWEAKQSSKPRNFNGQEIANLRLLSQAEVAADKLTNDPTWNIFLSYIQAAIVRTEQVAAEAEAVVMSPNVTNMDEMMAAKMTATIARSRVEAWKQVLELPRLLKRDGEKAKNILLELPDEETPPKTS